MRKTRPRRNTSDDDPDPSPEQRFEAVALERDFCRGTAEQRDDARQVERSTGQGGDAVSELESRLVAADAAYPPGARFLRRIPGR